MSVRAFDHPLYQHVFGAIQSLSLNSERPLEILDIGGRRSNYTIGVNGRLHITDIPRESDLQHSLDLGVTDEIRRRTLKRRSNVESYLIDDMTKSALPSNRFDVAVAIEVLEHVEADEAFVHQVRRVLKPGGTFIMSTPNGDFLRTPYPDHKRHYQRDQLAALLPRYFSDVDIGYVVNAGRLIRWGVHRPSLRTPFWAVIAPLALFITTRLESLGIGGEGPEGKRHLLAVATTPSIATHLTRAM